MKTQIDQIEIKRNGVIQVRLIKPGISMEAQSGYHRTVIPPGVDPDIQLNHVDDHLKKMGYPPLDNRSMVQQACKMFHTPDCIKKYCDKLMEVENVAESS